MIRELGTQAILLKAIVPSLKRQQCIMSMRITKDGAGDSGRKDKT